MGSCYDVLIEIESSSRNCDDIRVFLNYAMPSEEIKNFFVHFIADFCDHLKTHLVIDDYAIEERELKA